MQRTLPMGEDKGIICLHTECRYKEAGRRKVEGNHTNIKRGCLIPDSRYSCFSVSWGAVAMAAATLLFPAECISFLCQQTAAGQEAQALC